MIVTGLQPSGSIHIGNLLGAVVPLIERQQPAVGSVVFIADYHAITAGHNPTALRQNTISLAAMLIAAGIDEKTTLFKQSAVHAHTELQWILASTAARTGWLNRMTQFKEKSGGQLYEDFGCTAYEHLVTRMDEIAHASWRSVNGDNPVDRIKGMAKKTLDEVMTGSNVEGPSVGLYSYPVLQAADILLYQADEVPVGDDQSQHLNLTVDIAQKFNREFGQLFTVPKAIFSHNAKRIMSLTEPTRKMSKSDPNAASRIDLTDSHDVIVKKIRGATTDSDLIGETLDGRPGLKNLLVIYSAFTGKPLDDALVEFSGKGFGVLKPAVAEAVIEGLRKTQQEYHALMLNPLDIQTRLDAGAAEARMLADATMKAVRTAIGVD